MFTLNITVNELKQGDRIRFGPRVKLVTKIEIESEDKAKIYFNNEFYKCSNTERFIVIRLSSEQISKVLQ